MELKKAVAVCLIAMFAAALVVLIARALDMQAAAKLRPELQKIGDELAALREQISRGALGGNTISMQGGDSPAAGLRDGVVVYYAHGNTRCPTCRKIESQAHQAVTSGFADAIKAGSIRWEVVNYEEPEGKRFVNDYGVQMPVVVLLRIEDGRAVDWKRLDKVWPLVGDEAAFGQYVQAEIHAMREADSPVLPLPQTKPELLNVDSLDNESPGAELPQMEIPLPDTISLPDNLPSAPPLPQLAIPEAREQDN